MLWERKVVKKLKKKINQNKPDVIFLDVILPGKSGFEICRELKDNPNTSTIPVVFCSTKNTDVDKMWGDMLGADAFLSKACKKGRTRRSIAKIEKIAIRIAFIH